MSDGVLLKRYAKQIDKLQAELEVSIISIYANVEALYLYMQI